MTRSAMILAILIVIMLAASSFAQHSPNQPADKSVIKSKLLSMSLAFAENRGQWGYKTLFKANAGGATFYFCRSEVVYLFARNTNELLPGLIPDNEAPLRVPVKFNKPRFKQEALLIKAQFIGANPNVEVAGKNQLSQNCNYFHGNDPAQWYTDVPNYSVIMYKNIYPGIDIKYHGDGRSMKYDFIVNPEADISQIRIRYEGVDNLSISNMGDLQAQTRFGMIYENIPEIYQEKNGDKLSVSGRYRLIKPGVFGFVIEGDYDRAYPLVIDPTLIYSTYLGGSSDDGGLGIVWDYWSGCVFITGYTYSTDFPTSNPFQTYQGDYDAFVTKVAADGQSLVYSTYVGGNGTDVGCAIVMDGALGPYITGYTNSSNFPVTSSPYQASLAGGYDAFVTQIRASGNSLYFSTYLGGSDDDYGYAIAHDGNVHGHICLTGRTFSTNFPTTANAYQTYANIGDFPSDNAFVTRIDYARDLRYSTYLGGISIDGGHGIAVDGNGNMFVTGWTNSSNFPTTLSPFQGYQGGYDAFLIRFNGSSSVDNCTFLGGSSDDYGNGITVGSDGRIYIIGETDSPNFPTLNPYQMAQGGSDAFVTKFSPSGNSMLYGTYLGGNNDDGGEGIAVDTSGQVYLTGHTSSLNFPALNPIWQNPGLAGYDDAFVTKLAAGGNSLVYSTFLGGDTTDYGNSIAIDTGGNAYVTGETYSINFPTASPYDLSSNGFEDAFLSKLELVTPCAYILGDINGDDLVRGGDVVYGVRYFTGIGSTPPDSCFDTGVPTPSYWLYVSSDVNGDCKFMGSDITRLVSYFKGISALVNCHFFPTTPPPLLKAKPNTPVGVGK